MKRFRKKCKEGKEIVTKQNRGNRITEAKKGELLISGALPNVFYSDRNFT